MSNLLTHLKSSDGTRSGVLPLGATAFNFVGGQFRPAISEEFFTLPDPLTGAPMARVARSNARDADAAVSQLHTYLGRGDTWLDKGYGPEEWSKVLLAMADMIERYTLPLGSLMQRVMPCDSVQCQGEIVLLVRFLRTWGGNGIRFLRRGRIVMGTRVGQEAHTRWIPYGVTGGNFPFNFALEIEALQRLAALICGNVFVTHPHELTGLVTQVLIEIALECGMPPEFVCMVQGLGREVGAPLVGDRRIRMGLFTGSSHTFESMMDAGSRGWLGETSGVNWKLFGPYTGIVGDVDLQGNLTEGDAFSRSGQKCSALRLMFVHRTWVEAGLIEGIVERAGNRNLDDLTLAPVLTWATDRLLGRVHDLLSIDGATIVCGGTPEEAYTYVAPEALPGRSFDYGCIRPTVIQVPITALQDPRAADLLRVEVFGPISVLIVWDGEEQLSQLLQFLASIEPRLTAGIVTRDADFASYIARHTTNGVTYWGPGARTTAAPDWMRFGPTGSPYDACIGASPEDIAAVWMQRRDLCFEPAPNPLAML